jgi:hypothetical protein
MTMSPPDSGTVRTVGILAYGSLIDDPGEEIDEAIIDVKDSVLTPFKVEFARKSTTRGDAPTLVPVEDGGARAQAKIIVLDTPEQEAANRLYRRERRKVGSGLVYKNPVNPGPNKVVIQRIQNFEGVDVVLYTSIGANIEPLTAAELARFVIESALSVKDGLDGITYLIDARRNGIRTALSDEYEAEILREMEVRSLEQALIALRG